MKILIIAMLAIFPVVTAAQTHDLPQAPPAGNWALVEQLSKDAAIAMRMKAGDRIEGELIVLGAEFIELRVDGRERRFPRADVAEISQSGPRNRKRGALWGALIGFGAGFPVGYFAAPYITDDDEMPNSEQARAGATFGAIWGGIGAAVGALSASPHHVLIYRAQ